MSVYVDDMRASLGRLVMCHMIADSTTELMAMAVRIGIHPKWVQYAGSHREHFDVCLSKRRLAVSLGAVEISQRTLGEMLIRRRESCTPGKTR